MKDQDTLFFGRQMVPFDYDEKLAKGENCVVVTAHDNREKDKEHEDK